MNQETNTLRARNQKLHRVPLDYGQQILEEKKKPGKKVERNLGRKIRKGVKN